MFQECFPQLNALAKLLLCSNNGCGSHADEIASNWKVVSEQEYRAMKRRSSNAFALEAQKELLLAAKHLKLELEAERGDRVWHLQQSFLQLLTSFRYHNYHLGVDHHSVIHQ